MPAGKRLRTDYAAGQLEIRLEDAPAGTEVEAAPVPVAKRVSRLHSIAKRFRDRTEQHEVSRVALSRCVRIVHGLVTEAERRGYEVGSVEASTDSYGRTEWSGKNDGHLVITIRRHRYRLRVSEEKVAARGAWEREARWRASSPYGHLYGRSRVGRYDVDATGRVMLTLDGGYGREGRPATWGDRKSWTLEDKLPDVLCEFEVRAAEDDHRQLEAEREAEERRRRWELAMERARERFGEAHRAKVLRTQVSAWQEAGAIRPYMTALKEAYGESAQASEWIDWIRAYLERLDPLRSQPAMPESTDPSPEDLKPFLGGHSPYGPPVGEHRLVTGLTPCTSVGRIVQPVQQRWLAPVFVVGVLAFSSLAWAADRGTKREAGSTRSALPAGSWSVLTAQRSTPQALNLSTTKRTTVAALRSQSVQRGAGGSRGSGVESTVYEVRARLVEAKLEEDSDIHLVIKGVTTSGTMIVEFPTVACSSGATQGAKTRIKNARNAFVAACGMPGASSFTNLKGKATIRGVGFFDFLHGQTGVAPNGIELHPVLRFMDATCQVVP